MSGLLSSFENAMDMEMPRPGADEITKELLSKYNKRLRERGEEEVDVSNPGFQTMIKRARILEVKHLYLGSRLIHSFIQFSF